MSEEVAEAAGDRAWAVRLTQENAELRSLASRLNEQLRIADAEIAAYAERADKAETELAAAQAIIAGLRRSLAAANERAEQAEAKVAGLSLAADQYSVSRDAWMIKAKAAEERADKAEMERKAWTEIGAKAQADAGALYQALDTAITLCHIPEQNQDEEWYKQFEAVIVLFHEEHPGAALLAVQASQAEQLSAAVEQIRRLVEQGDQLEAALNTAMAELDHSQPIVIAATRLDATIRGDGNGRCWCAAREADQLRSALEKARRDATL